MTTKYGQIFFLEVRSLRELCIAHNRFNSQALSSLVSIMQRAIWLRSRGVCIEDGRSVPGAGIGANNVHISA